MGRIDAISMDGQVVVNNPPKRSVKEEVGNAISHGVGALFALLAILLMLTASKSAVEVFSATVYFVGMFLTFTISCLYHSFRYGSRVKRLFRRLDYLSIYLLIGATFAPILLSCVGGTAGLVFFCAQWAVIFVGVTLISIFGTHKLRPLHFTLYFILGWSGLMLIPQMIAHSWVLFACVLGGGVIYTLGIIPFFLNRRASHFVWHFFVLGGAVAQWLGIYIGIFL